MARALFTPVLSIPSVAPAGGEPAAGPAGWAPDGGRSAGPVGADGATDTGAAGQVGRGVRAVSLGVRGGRAAGLLAEAAWGV